MGKDLSTLVFSFLLSLTILGACVPAANIDTTERFAREIENDSRFEPKDNLELATGNNGSDSNDRSVQSVLSNIFARHMHESVTGSNIFYKDFKAEFYEQSSTQVQNVFSNGQCNGSNTEVVTVSPHHDVYKEIQCRVMSDGQYNSSAQRNDCYSYLGGRSPSSCVQIILTSGDHVIRKPIAITKDNVLILGRGSNNTTLKLKDNVDASGKGAFNLNAENITLKNFRLNHSNRVSYGVLIGQSRSSPSNISLERMTFGSRARTWIRNVNGLLIHDSTYVHSPGNRAMIGHAQTSADHQAGNRNLRAQNVVIAYNQFGLNDSDSSFVNEAIDFNEEASNIVIAFNNFRTRAPRVANTGSLEEIIEHEDRDNYEGWIQDFTQREEILDIGSSSYGNGKIIQNVVIAQNKFFCNGRSSSAIFVKQESKDIVIESNDFTKGRHSCLTGHTSHYKRFSHEYRADGDHIYGRAAIRVHDIRGTMKVSGNVFSWDNHANNRRPIISAEKTSNASSPSRHVIISKHQTQSIQQTWGDRATYTIRSINNREE